MKELFLGLGALLGLYIFLYMVTAPAGDQVCRMNKNWMVETMHGTGWQPTCQTLIDRIEDKASRAQDKAAELEERLAAVEERLNL